MSVSKQPSKQADRKKKKRTAQSNSVGTACAICEKNKKKGGLKNGKEKKPMADISLTIWSLEEIAAKQGRAVEE